MRQVTKWLGVALSVLLMVGLLTANSAMAARKNVIIGSLTWSGSQAIEQIMKYVLEEKLDIDVEITTVAQPVLWAALDKGSADVYPDIWMPNQKAGWDKYVEGRKSVAAKLSYDKAAEGFWMPVKIAKEHGIKSVFDLKGKEKMFDTNGDGKGEMWVGPFDWAVTDKNIAKIKNYGLDLEAVKIQQWLFLAILKESMRKDKPLVFYYWQPEWPMAKYDLIKLEEPPYDDAKPMATAFPPATIYVGVSKKMKERLPKAYKFFMNWYMPIDEVSTLIADLEDVPGNPKKDSAKVAKDWVESNPKIVNDWLKGVR
ncbi:MAG: hypothetical protein JSU72_02380 [Deltaproteobacteria bacterium]|nr:MAG: hypothetical protein JSU72_02380 [Deltaproteobacteria bacterium]